MENGKNQAPDTFMGLSREQIAKIIYEEMSKTGFQFNNFNTMIPSIVSRIMAGSSIAAGNYWVGIFLKGLMNNLFRNQG